MEETKEKKPDRPESKRVINMHHLFTEGEFVVLTTKDEETLPMQVKYVRDHDIVLKAGRL